MSVEIQRGDQLSQSRAFLGVCLMLAGFVLYPISDALIKHLMETYSVHQMTFLRALSRAVPLLIVASLQGGLVKALSTKKPYDHLIRLGANLLYTFSFMYSFKLDTLTVVYTLSYTSPFFMILLSAWMLNTRPGRQGRHHHKREVDRTVQTRV